MSPGQLCNRPTYVQGVFRVRLLECARNLGPDGWMITGNWQARMKFNTLKEALAYLAAHDFREASIGGNQ